MHVPVIRVWNRASRRLFPAVSFGAALVLAVALSQRLAGQGVSWVAPPPEAGFRWTPEVFRTVTFGHWPAAIDWLWLKALGDPSISHVREGQHPPAYYYFDLATDLDPAFLGLYIMGANYLVVIRNDREGALKLLLKAERFRTEELPKYPASFRAAHWEAEWSVPLLLGYTYLFEYEDLASASTAFRNAAGLQGAPAYLRSLAGRVETRAGQFDVGLRLLDFMIAQNQEGQVRDQLILKRHWLQVSRFMYDLNSRFRRFLDGRRPAPAEFERFIGSVSRSPVDHWGGRLFMDEAGVIRTSTPHETVFGISD